MNLREMKKTIYLYLFILFFLLLFNCSNAGAAPAKNPNSAKACAICHYRWVDTFFIEGKGSDLVGYQSEKVVATPEMCFSCHDGSVKDSRARVNNDSGHKTNMAPPSHMKIPEIFPLDEDGKMQCSTCHTAHGVPSGTGARDTIFLRTSNKDSTMCRQCHPNMDGGVIAGNHPVDSTKQEIPPGLIALGAAAGYKKNQLICESCHTAHGSLNASFLVETTGNSDLCLACHRDKEIFTPDGKKKPFHVINVAPQKVKIPEELIEKGAKLGDKGVITCQTCHKVHNNKIEHHLLLIRKDEKSSLCLTCHADKQYLADTKHNLLHSKAAERNLEGKTVAEAGVCSACHLPHKAARRLSGEKDFTTQLCLSCHGKGKIAERVNLSGKTHPLIVNPFEKQNSNGALGSSDIKKQMLTLPLFNKYGVQDKSGKMTCATCHDPHGAPADSIISPTVKNGKTDKSTLFLRKQSPEICRECHNNKFDIADSKHDLQKTAPGERNILSQTLSESGLCGSCHLVHGSQKGFLWARQSAAVNGNNSVQGMCYSCHNEKGIAKKKVHHGYSHPINIAPSKKGLSTNLPLLDHNGKYANGGIMTCHTCHDPHKWHADSNRGSKSQNEKGDKKTTSFLRKQSPEICRECHNDKFYIANSKHDLNKVAPGEKNILKQTPLESGLCGTCHIVHNARQKYLWARKMPMEIKGTPEQLCLDCHREKGLAAKKAIKGYSHPVNIAPAQNGLKTTLPLFTLNSKTTENDVMTCFTCHDPHRWDPLKTASEDHFDIEGNAQNSFLRIENSPSPKLCENCHADKATIEMTDHDLTITAPASKNIIDQTPEESGTCGVCHLVHNGKNQFKLWAQGFGGGDSLMDTMCTTCHSEKGWAKNKIPLISTHPISKIVNMEHDFMRRRSYIPLFHPTTGEPVKTGEISCPSCHNVHQWNPASKNKGQGANLEGNATNSFLRSRSAILKCKDCHNVDALFKFKFFHNPSKRKKQSK
jgi:predicted CXXCH cytochrome family protein